MKQFTILFLLVFAPLLAKANIENPQWYAKGGVGINYLNASHVKHLDLDIDTGLCACICIGHQFNENLRTEVESAYRLNQGYAIYLGRIGSDLKGTVHAYSALINLILDFPFQDRFVFSIGAGTGLHKSMGALEYSFSAKSNSDPDVIDMRKEGIAVQGLMGIKIKFTPRISLLADYKYWKAPDFNQYNTLGLNLALTF